MSFQQISNVKIKGVAACVPEKVIENKESSLFTEEELAKFFTTVGVERRHCVDSGMTTSDLCLKASEQLLADLAWDKSEINALVFVSQTPDYRNPPTSCILQDRLKLPINTMAFDISMGCSGYVYGLSVLAGLMSSGHIKRALLLVGDTTSLTSSPQDKSRALLFGDAGTATALEYDEDAEKIQVQLATDGSGYQAIYTPHSGFRNRITPESFKMEDFGGGIVRARVHSWLDGLEVFAFGIKRAPQSFKQTIEHFNIDVEKTDYFLFHQANLMMNEKIRKKLKLPQEKVPYNLKDYGNTSCATIPLLMVTNLRTDLVKNELSAILCAFGVGLSWGNIHIHFDKIVVPKLLYL